jgi:CO/xanthine dehydrogenase FAD-binding subunit
MITEYYRPTTLEEAIALLKKPTTVPLGGGSLLSLANDEQFSVVDLQLLGLNKIHSTGDQLEIGATATLNQLMESKYIPPALKSAIRLEATYNLRNTGTAAGTLVSCEGRSPFGTTMLAMDSRLIIAGENEPLALGDYYPVRKKAGSQYFFLPGKLITKITVRLNIKICYESVARTPDDLPIICAALARWPSGRTRIVLGGWGASPTMAMDGNDSSGIEQAAKNAFSEAGDEWASAEYRRSMAAVLARRCMQSLKQNQANPD